MKITFTASRFAAALRRAEADDRCWPWLGSAAWLLAHARSRDGEVVVETDGSRPPEPLWQSIGRRQPEIRRLLAQFLGEERRN